MMEIILGARIAGGRTGGDLASLWDDGTSSSSSADGILGVCGGRGLWKKLSRGFHLRFHDVVEDAQEMGRVLDHVVESEGIMETAGEIVHRGRRKHSYEQSIPYS